MLTISVSCLILTLMILRLEVCLLKRNSVLAMLRCEKSRLLVKCPDIEQEQLPHLIHHHCYIWKWGRTRRTRPQRPVFSIISQVFHFPPKKTATKITETRTLQECRQAFNKFTKGSYTLDFKFSGFLSHCKMSSFSNSALELCVSSLEAFMTLKEIDSLTFIFLILKNQVSWHFLIRKSSVVTILHSRTENENVEDTIHLKVACLGFLISGVHNAMLRDSFLHPTEYPGSYFHFLD